jgi:hypothetical protein
LANADTGLEIDDAIVLLLGAPSRIRRLSGRIDGVTRLEKLIFLLERETSAKEWIVEDAEFTAHNFGPFSSKVYQAVDMLSAAEIIEDTGATSDTEEDTWEINNVVGELPVANDPYVTRDFTLTERGWRYYKALLQGLPDGALEELTGFKNRFAPLPLRQLVRYVYQRYEDFTHKSLIRDEVLGR